MAAPPKRTKHDLSHKPRSKSHHRSAYLLLGVLAALIVVAMILAKDQTLQINPDHASSNAFVKKIVFTGDLKMPDLGLTDTDLNRLGSSLNRYADNFKQIRIWAEKQDSYAAMGPNTELRYKVTVITKDEVRIQSVVSRSTPARLVDDMLRRLQEDVTRYHETRGKVDSKPGSFSNTM